MGGGTVVQFMRQLITVVVLLCMYLVAQWMSERTNTSSMLQAVGGQPMIALLHVAGMWTRRQCSYPYPWIHACSALDSHKYPATQTHIDD